MKIAVIGAGAIGCLVAGYLKLRAEDVTLVGHADAAETIQKDGVRISGVRGDFCVRVPVQTQLDLSPELVILATKTQDLGAALKDSSGLLSDSALVTTQNGVRADGIVAEFLPRKNILSSIVMFGATLLCPGRVVHNFEGAWILGNAFGNNDETTIAISQILTQAFPAIVSEELQGMKYLKVFVNANNCIPAILGISMQEAFSDVRVSAIGIAVWREGLEIIQKSGITLVSLPDFPLERLTKLTSMPLEQAAGVYSGIMKNLSKEPLYGSILQSIKRGKPSEIEYINGEFVRLAKERGCPASLNEKLVKMVHQVEANGEFFSKEALLSAAKGLYQ